MTGRHIPWWGPVEVALAEGLEDVAVDHPAAKICHEPLERIDAVGDGRIVLHVLLG